VPNAKEMKEIRSGNHTSSLRRKQVRNATGDTSKPYVSEVSQGRKAGR